MFWIRPQFCWTFLVEKVFQLACAGCALRVCDVFSSCMETVMESRAPSYILCSVEITVWMRKRAIIKMNLLNKERQIIKHCACSPRPCTTSLWMESLFRQAESCRSTGTGMSGKGQTGCKNNISWQKMFLNILKNLLHATQTQQSPENRFSHALTCFTTLHVVHLQHTCKCSSYY